MSVIKMHSQVYQTLEGVTVVESRHQHRDDQSGTTQTDDTIESSVGGLEAIERVIVDPDDVVKAMNDNYTPDTNSPHLLVGDVVDGVATLHPETNVEIGGCVWKLKKNTGGDEDQTIRIIPELFVVGDDGGDNGGGGVSIPSQLRRPHKPTMKTNHTQSDRDEPFEVFWKEQLKQWVISVRKQLVSSIRLTGTHSEETQYKIDVVYDNTASKDC